MRLAPIAEFYFKHGDELDSLAASASSDGTAALALDLVAALAPVIKKHRPDLNKNGMIDDAAKMLTDMFVTESGRGPSSAGG